MKHVSDLVDRYCCHVLQNGAASLPLQRRKHPIVSSVTFRSSLQCAARLKKTSAVQLASTGPSLIHYCSQAERSVRVCASGALERTGGPAHPAPSAFSALESQVTPR